MPVTGVAIRGVHIQLRGMAKKHSVPMQRAGPNIDKMASMMIL